jgi:energy-coupling factor transporter ATP-binding protein EcfA2
VGPNGIGKSTLLGLISGELEPTRGHVQRNSKVRGRAGGWPGVKVPEPGGQGNGLVRGGCLSVGKRGAPAGAWHAVGHPFSSTGACSQPPPPATTRPLPRRTALLYCPAVPLLQVRLAVFSQHHVDGLDLALTPLQYMCKIYPEVGGTVLLPYCPCC